MSKNISHFCDYTFENVELGNTYKISNFEYKFVYTDSVVFVLYNPPEGVFSQNINNVGVYLPSNLNNNLLKTSGKPPLDIVKVREDGKRLMISISNTRVSENTDYIIMFELIPTT